MSEQLVRRAQLLIGLAPDEQVELLTEIKENTEALFRAITGAATIEPRFSFMLVEVMVKRYNRIGAEGMSQERQVDLLHVFQQDDFEPYMELLNREFGLLSLVESWSFFITLIMLATPVGAAPTPASKAIVSLSNSSSPPLLSIGCYIKRYQSGLFTQFFIKWWA